METNSCLENIGVTKITKEARYKLSRGEQRHSDEKWLAIILEELGEAAKAVLEKNEEGILEETVQVAALLQAWVTSRDFFFDTGTDRIADPSEAWDSRRSLVRFYRPSLPPVAYLDRHPGYPIARLQTIGAVQHAIPHRATK